MEIIDYNDRANDETYKDLMGVLPPLPAKVQVPSEVVDHYQPHHSTREAKIEAINKIVKAWQSYSMRRTFQYLKEGLHRAERTLSCDILKRLSPKEAEFHNDPSLQTKIRFRFGGTAFPPIIMYKVYTKGMSIQYFSGHRVIQAGSQAAMDSCSIMGARVYRQCYKVEEMFHDSFGIYESYEVDNKMEFVQYLNSLDERPAYMGGRNNGWRELTIGGISTESILFDVASCKKDTKIVNKSHLPRYIRKGGMPAKSLAKLNPKKNSSRAMQKNTKSKKNKGFVDQAGDIDFEEEFGMLYEWTSHLSLDHLQDYTFAS